MKKFIILSLLIVVSSANAEPFTLSVDLDMLELNEAVVTSEGIEPEVLVFGATVVYQKSMLKMAGHLGGFGLKDNAGFTQEVIDIYGSTSVEGSSAGGISLGAEIGPSVGFGPVEADLMFGARKMLASRSIPNCTNCDVEQIKIPMATYVMPKVHFFFTPAGAPMKMGASLGYLYGMSGDSIDSSIQFSFVMRGDLGL